VSTKKLVFRLIICAFLIPIFIVPFIKIFSLETNLGVIEKYGMFANYNEVPFVTIGGSLNAIWFVANNIFIILLFVAAIVYIVLFILDVANIEIINSDKIIKYLGMFILTVSILAVLSGLIGTLTNQQTSTVTDTIFAKMSGEPGYYLQYFPIVSGILAVIPLHEE